MTNSLAIPAANKALKQIKDLEKTLTDLSKVCFDDVELTLLNEASNSLDIASKRISKIRGWF